MGIHTEGNNLFLNIFSYQQMAVARSIFTLYGAVQLFLAAFDMSMTMVPLKVAIGLEKYDFWAFKKNRKNSPGYTCVTSRSKAAQNN